eukprot:361791-Chlamydomonas_euryale.AAC.9
MLTRCLGFLEGSSRSGPSPSHAGACDDTSRVSFAQLHNAYVIALQWLDRGHHAAGETNRTKLNASIGSGGGSARQGRTFASSPPPQTPLSPLKPPMPEPPTAAAAVGALAEGRAVDWERLDAQAWARTGELLREAADLLAEAHPTPGECQSKKGLLR